MDFENEHLSLIGQYESSATDIERIFFTKRYNFSKKHFSLLAVQSISILYSYWEGYIQKSFQLYIDYINSLDIDFFTLSDEIMVFHMEQTFKQFKEYPKEIKKKISFYQKLQSHYFLEGQTLTRIVNTENNVGFSVLNRLLRQFSLEEFSEDWNQSKYPNSNLKEMLTTFLRYRNGIVHGGDVSSEEKISQKVYSKYRILIVDLMYEIHHRFMDGIHQETYIKGTHRKGTLP